jgi:hypothetical protein
MAHVELSDNAGAAIAIETADRGKVSIAVDDSTAQHLGSSFLEVVARGTSTVRLAVHRTRVVAPGSVKPLIATTLAGGSHGCIDVAGNELVSNAGITGIALSAKSPAASLQVVLPATTPPNAVAAELGRTNGATATVDATNMTIVPDCR